MKSLIFAVVVSFSTHAFAQTTSLVVDGDNDSSVEIAWLGSEADESAMNAAWENGGQTAVFNGDLCFKGYRQNAIKILQYMGDNDFMGDEMLIQDVQAAPGGKISYVIYDGPNDVVANEVTIGLCN